MLTPGRMMALTLGPDPSVPGAALGDTDEQLEELYWRHRDKLLAGVTPRSLPWAWWEFEGPPELRAGRPKLLPVEDSEAIAADRQRLDTLATARAAYLARAA
jgi:hypothetical protein